jgi:hypothetical protein
VIQQTICTQNPVKQATITNSLALPIQDKKLIDTHSLCKPTLHWQKELKHCTHCLYEPVVIHSRVRPWLVYAIACGRQYFCLATNFCCSYSWLTADESGMNRRPPDPDPLRCCQYVTEELHVSNWHRTSHCADRTYTNHWLQRCTLPTLPTLPTYRVDLHWQDPERQHTGNDTILPPQWSFDYWSLAQPECDVATLYSDWRMLHCYQIFSSTPIVKACNCNQGHCGSGTEAR